MEGVPEDVEGVAEDVRVPTGGNVVISQYM